MNVCQGWLFVPLNQCKSKSLSTFWTGVKWHNSCRIREQKMLFSVILFYIFCLQKVVIFSFFQQSHLNCFPNNALGLPSKVEKIWWAAFYFRINLLEGCLPQNRRILDASKQSEIVFFPIFSLFFLFSCCFVLAIVVGFQWLLHKSQVKTFFFIQRLAFFFLIRPK